MPIIQEKNQATLEGSGDGKTAWASAEGARVSHPQTSLEMPPGYSIEEGSFKNVAGSDGEIEDETNSPFYEDVGGFAERWTVLDRSG